MAPQKELRFGIIGLGLMGREFASVIGRWHHLLDFPVKPRIVGVCDTNPKLHGWFQEAVPGVTCHADYHELLKNPDIDAIYCAVPHSLHEALYLDILAAEKHLLGEKPFGIDQKANAAIGRAIAARPDLLVRCCSEFPYFPGAQRVIQAAQAGRFGRIIEVNSGFQHSSDMDFQKPLNWKRDVAVNGEYGCMGDLGMHALHVPLRLGWYPKRLSAVLSKIVEQRPDGKGGLAPCLTWDNAQIQCEVESQGQAFPMTVKTQRIAPGETDTWYLEVKGTKYSAAFSTKHPKTFRSLEYMDGGEQAWKHEDLGYKSAYKTITGEIFEFGFTDALLQMWASFCDELGGKPAAQLPFGCASPAEAAQSHAILTAALQSHKEKKVVDLL
jgi:predicted dehydrogenase